MILSEEERDVDMTEGEDIYQRGSVIHNSCGDVSDSLNMVMKRAGVNYASASAGIRAETGQQLGARIDFTGQVSNYKNTVAQVVDILGDEDTTADYLSKCIYSIGVGSNDYLNNYFMPKFYSTANQYLPDQYADALIEQYTQQLRVLFLFCIPSYVPNTYM
ncbi:hypothetical protein ACS0TY_021317 [Phlomoides rotata]